MCLRQCAMIDNSDDYTLPMGEGEEEREWWREERKGDIMTLMIITELLIPESSTKELCP